MTVWIAAAKRRAVAEIAVGPADIEAGSFQRRDPALDQMVLVGHSMGGLVSRLQTVDGGDDFWKLVSDEPYALVFDANGTMLRVQKVKEVNDAKYTTLGWNVSDIEAMVQLS